MPTPLQRSGEQRFALRFESGERSGETIPLGEGGAVLGRRPGCTLQVVEASVSGKHAEIVLDDQGALLRDLGSTNGTRVGNERIREARLSNGDEFFLGNVKLVFLDRLAAEPAPTPPEPPHKGLSGSAGVGEELRRISRERILHLGRRSLWPMAALLAAAAALPAAWFFLLRSKGGEKARRGGTAAVAPIPGNLLERGFSFEDEDSGWMSLDAATDGFTAEPTAARSGALGLRAELVREGAPEAPWAWHESARVSAASGRSLEARAWLRVQGAAALRLGMAFSDSGGRAERTIAWSPALRDTAGGEQTSAGEWREVAVQSPVPPGYDGLSLVLLAELEAAADSRGFADADDASLVQASAVAAPPVSFEESQLHLLGTPSFGATLFKIDRVVLSGVCARNSNRAGSIELSARREEHGVRLELDGQAQGPCRVAFRVEPAKTPASAATTGEGGRRVHTLEFRRENATSVLIGDGRDLMRVQLPRPGVVSGRPHEDAFEIEVELGSPEPLFLQLRFNEERARALELSQRARSLEQAGQPGLSIAVWQELLDEVPIEKAAVEEAEVSRARLVQAGFEEIQAARMDLERARFFRLAELCRGSHARSRDIERRYAESEVAQSARELALEIDRDLAALEMDGDRQERARLERILAALEAGRTPGLAESVRTYLAQRLSESPAPTDKPAADTEEQR